MNQRWDVAILEHSHNHEPSQRPELSNAYRRFARANEEKATGVSLLQKVATLTETGMTLGTIAATLSTSQRPVLREDVKTAVRALRRSKHGPHSAGGVNASVAQVELVGSEAPSSQLEGGQIQSTESG